MAMKKAIKLRDAPKKRGMPLGTRLVDDRRATTLRVMMNSAELASLDRLAKRLKSTRSAAIRHAIQKAVESDD